MNGQELKLDETKGYGLGYKIILPVKKFSDKQ